MKKKERGQIAVEFALVVILAIIMFLEGSVKPDASYCHRNTAIV